MPFVLGLDFGTQACRALLVDLDDPTHTREGVSEYRHGVLSEQLADGTPLAGGDWALHDADDYLEALRSAFERCLGRRRGLAAQVVGIGVDATASSPLPTDAHGAPLSRRYRSRPHAYVKLWKHHRAVEEAERIQRTAGARRVLAHYGGAMSCEWLFPKALELARCDRELFAAAERWIEVGDWIVWQLGGELTRNSCAAGFKGMYRAGWPSRSFLARVDPLLAELIAGKLDGALVAPGRRAGGLRDEWSRRLGIPSGTPISAATIDAHSGLLGMGATRARTLGVIMGTSSCHLFVDRKERAIEGVMGVVADGILPGTCAYEAGQAAVGDLFDLFVKRLLPEGSHEHWTALAAGVPPGSRGLVALDWVNGCRSPLKDAELSGAVFGLTLDTRPEELYRALLEATAFGTRGIVERCRAAGVRFREVVVCGGLATNELLLQITADVLKLPVHVAASSQAVALGAAMYGALAAGRDSDDLVRPPARRYDPDRARGRRYDRCYERYVRMHDHFGGREDLLRELRRTRNEP